MSAHPTNKLGTFAGVCLWLGLIAVLPPPIFADETEPTPGPAAPPASAVDATVWGALIYGGPDARPYPEREIPEDFPALAERMKKVFDHEHFSLLGHHVQGIFREYESWVVPSKDLFLKVDSKGRTEDGEGLRLHLQVWQGKKVLVKTDAVLLPDDPLFIAGPRWGDGQLFFVVKLQPPVKADAGE